MRIIRKSGRILVLAACVAIVGLGTGALNPLFAKAPSTPTPQRDRIVVAIGPAPGQVGYLDPAAGDPPAANEQLSSDGPFLVYDAPTGGNPILWYFHTVGPRPIGDSPSAEEVQRNAPVTRSGYGPPPVK